MKVGKTSVHPLPLIAYSTTASSRFVFVVKVVSQSQVRGSDSSSLRHITDSVIGVACCIYMKN